MKRQFTEHTMSISPPNPAARLLCENDNYTNSQVAALLQFIQTPDGQKQAQKTTHFRVQARKRSQQRLARVVITVLAVIVALYFVLVTCTPSVKLEHVVVPLKQSVRPRNSYNSQCENSNKQNGIARLRVNEMCWLHTSKTRQKQQERKRRQQVFPLLADDALRNAALRKVMRAEHNKMHIMQIGQAASKRQLAHQTQGVDIVGTKNKTEHWRESWIARGDGTPQLLQQTSTTHDEVVDLARAPNMSAFERQIRAPAAPCASRVRWLLVQWKCSSRRALRPQTQKWTHKQVQAAPGTVSITIRHRKQALWSHKLPQHWQQQRRYQQRHQDQEPLNASAPISGEKAVDGAALALVAGDIAMKSGQHFDASTALHLYADMVSNASAWCLSLLPTLIVLSYALARFGPAIQPRAHSIKRVEQLCQGARTTIKQEQPGEHSRYCSEASPAVVSSARRHANAKISPPVFGAHAGVAQLNCNALRPIRRVFASAPTHCQKIREEDKDVHPLLDVNAPALRPEYARGSHAECSEWAEWDALLSDDSSSSTVGKDMDMDTVTTAAEEEEFLDAWEALQTQMEPLKSAIREHDDDDCTSKNASPMIACSCVAIV